MDIFDSTTVADKLEVITRFNFLYILKDLEGYLGLINWF